MTAMLPDRMILDGGLATELETRGHDLSDALWSARVLRDAPGEVQAVHEAFVAAGAECVTTASYQVHFDNAGKDAPQLLVRSVELARASGARHVAASVGPFGAVQADGSEYRGDDKKTEAELRDWHEERFRILDEAGADLLACETLPSLREARALATLLNRTPAWFSFTLRDEAHLSDGTPLEEVGPALAAYPQAVALGVNCVPPRLVAPALERLATEKRRVAYPNSGEIWDAGVRRWIGARDPGDSARLVVRWPADWVGGCCRVGPEHVRALARRLAGSG